LPSHSAMAAGMVRLPTRNGYEPSEASGSNIAPVSGGGKGAQRPPITGRGVSHRSNDQKLARRAPVHGVVRQPAEVAVAIRHATAAPTTQPRGLQARRLRAAARRLAFHYRRLTPREGGCAAGEEVEACASESRMDTAARPVSAGARRQGLLASGQRGRLAGADEPLGLYRAQMSNARHQRAAERQWLDRVSCAAAAPLHVVVRPRPDSVMGSRTAPLACSRQPRRALAPPPSRRQRRRLPRMPWLPRRRARLGEAGLTCPRNLYHLL